LVTDLPWYLAVPLGLGGAFGSVALRRWGGPTGIELAVGPALVGVGALALSSPASPQAALLAGASALAVVIWMSDDPSRSPGALRRAAPTVFVTVLAFVVAWGSALLLPSTPGELGLAGGLLALSLILIAVLLGWPHLLDREPAATA
jgi:hypothetical protein